MEKSEEFQYWSHLASSMSLSYHSVFLILKEWATHSLLDMNAGTAQVQDSWSTTFNQQEMGTDGYVLPLIESWDHFL